MDVNPFILIETIENRDGVLVVVVYGITNERSLEVIVGTAPKLMVGSGLTTTVIGLLVALTIPPTVDLAV